MHIKHLVILATLAISGLSQAAVTFEGNPNTLETPLGRGNITDIDSTVASRRDSNFNRAQVETRGNSFTATAIGNLINVETTGSNNTVVIYANQSNTGSQRASLGRLGLGE